MSGECAEMRRPAMAAAMMPAPEMVPVTAATMAAAVMTTTMTAAAATTVAAFRDRKIRHRQRRCEDKRGNPDCDP